LVHDVQVEADVGATSEPHVVADPASHAEGTAGGPPLVGDGAPHGWPFGTQTLTWSPANVVSGVHVVLELHSSPFGHGAAQNVSPWNCAQVAPVVQSAFVVHAWHALEPATAPASLRAPPSSGDPRSPLLAPPQPTHEVKTSASPARTAGDLASNVE
jgi:hypothetical protein